MWGEKIIESSLQDMFIRSPTHMQGLSLLFLLILIQASSCNIKVTGLIGQNVTLPCTYDTQSSGGLTFCWGLGTLTLFKCSNLILRSQNGDVLFRESTRYQLLGRVTEGDLSLTIINAQRGDAGVYGCRVEVSGWFNDQKVNTELIMEEAPSEQPITQKCTTSYTTTKEIPTLAPNHFKMETFQSQTNEGIFTASLGVGNISRMLCFFFLTIIIILILIIRRKVVSRRKQRVDTFAAENIYESIPMTK